MSLAPTPSNLAIDYLLVKYSRISLIYQFFHGNAQELMFSIPFPWNNQMHSDQMVKGPITHLKDILYELENTQNICNGPQKKRSGCFLGKVFMHWFLELNNLLLYIGADPVKVIHSYEGQKPELLFLFLLSATVRCNRPALLCISKSSK